MNKEEILEKAASELARSYGHGSAVYGLDRRDSGISLNAVYSDIQEATIQDLGLRELEEALSSLLGSPTTSVKVLDSLSPAHLKLRQGLATLSADVLQ